MMNATYNSQNHTFTVPLAQLGTWDFIPVQITVKLGGYVHTFTRTDLVKRGGEITNAYYASDTTGIRLNTVV